MTKTWLAAAAALAIMTGGALAQTTTSSTTSTQSTTAAPVPVTGIVSASRSSNRPRTATASRPTRRRPIRTAPRLLRPVSWRRHARRRKRPRPASSTIDLDAGQRCLSGLLFRSAGANRPIGTNKSTRLCFQESANDQDHIEVRPDARRGTARRSGRAGWVRSASARGYPDQQHGADHDDDATPGGVHDNDDHAAGSATVT